MGNHRSHRYKNRGNMGLMAVVVVLFLSIFTLVAGINLIKGVYHRVRNNMADSKQQKDVNNSVNTDKPSVTPNVDKPTPVETPWYLVLVNNDNPIPENFSITLKDVGRGYQVDARIADALTSMLNACKKQGLNPIICSAYRTNDYQNKLFQNKVKKLEKTGMGHEKAVSAAKTAVAYPGTSEHELGLAVDIVSLKYQLLDDNQENTKEFKWLSKHCAEYGFIVRYPDGKTDITGIIYEPWHFRYVGVEVAKEIMYKGITMEEYLGK